jgi:hypothetical protein
VAVPGAARHNAIMPEIITDPEIPGAARRQLQQAPLSALLGFADPVPRPDATGKTFAPTARTVARYVMGTSLAGALVLLVLSLAVAQPGPLLVFALLYCLPVAVVSALLGYREPVLETGGDSADAAVTWHRRYVVPELDLHGATLEQWRRARAASTAIQTSEAVRRGLVDTVEITTVLPYLRWQIAERLALLSEAERRASAVMAGLDADDADVEAVRGRQREVHDLTVAELERLIAPLAEFARLTGQADAALRKQRAIEELTQLNPHYEELLTRLGEPGSTLDVDGSSGQELRALATAAKDAVRRANEAGQALALPDTGR